MDIWLPKFKISLQKDRLVIPVPLYHCFGMVMGNLGCISHGATMIYPKDSFDPLSVLETVEREKATALYGVPTMFFAMLNHTDFKQFNMSSLRTGVMAGSLCPSELMKRVNNEMVYYRNGNCLWYDRNEPCEYPNTA